jgi:hypothetical protein
LCHKEIDNCNDYDKITAGKCVHCKDKFTLNKVENSCPSETKNCKDHNEKAKCTECVDRTFVLQHEHCHLIVQNCKEYNQQKDGVCEQCEENHIKQNNMCHLKVEKCSN